MSSNKVLSFIIIFIAGAIIPFVPELALLEVFCLLIPLAIIFILSFCNLIINLVRGNYRKENRIKEALYQFSLILCFLLCQIGSGFIVGKVQRMRSESLITELETIKNKTGTFPEKYPTYLGITFVKESNQENYRIEYTTGFLVMEIYQHTDKTWISYGWND